MKVKCVYKLLIMLHVSLKLALNCIITHTFIWSGQRTYCIATYSCINDCLATYYYFLYTIYYNVIGWLLCSFSLSSY